MDNRETIKRLVSLLAGYKKEAVTIVCCLFFSTVLSFCIPLVGSHIMDDGYIGRNTISSIRAVICSSNEASSGLF